MNFNQNLIEVCSSGPNELYSRTGSENGLAAARQKAIVWIKDGKFTDA